MKFLLIYIIGAICTYLLFSWLIGEKDFESKKKQLNEYEKYLDDYKNRLSQAQKKFYEYQKSELAKINKEKEKLFKLTKENDKNDKLINKNYSTLRGIITKFEGSVKKIDE